MTSVMQRWSGQAANGIAGHVCNCIGCCTKCGQCRTSPLHTPLHCDAVRKWKASYPKATA